MENWEKIIKGYSQTSDNSTVKLIDAIVISVASQFVAADVKLVTGQIIEKVPNASGNKLFVGQNVKVGYRTTPNAGWIDITGGKPNPLRLVGYDVETAAVFDINNIHQWTAEQEMICDINANTKLMYGGHPRLVSLQGNTCRFASAPITIDDTMNFGNHLEFDSLWRDNADSPFIECRHTVDLFVNEMTYSTASSSSPEYYNYVMVMDRKRYNKNTGELLYSNRIENLTYFRTPTDVFIIPYFNSISFASEYAGQSTPYGYVKHNNLYLLFGAIEAHDPSVIKTTNGKSGSYSANINLVGTGGNNGYSCIPLNSFAEKCFDLAVTKRTVPS